MSDWNDRPMAGPTYVDCPCGCGAHGTAKKKNGHVARKCSCASCRNGNNRRRGMTAQRAFQKAAGIKQAVHRSINGNEEAWRDFFRWEHKADGRHAKPVVTSFLSMEAQANLAKAVGDPRPMAAGVTYNGVRLVIVRAEDWATHVAPRLDEP